MAKLKGVIFGVENVLIKPGEAKPHIDTLRETGRLVRFLEAQGVESVVLSNHRWVVRNGTIEKPLQDEIQRSWGVDLTWYQCGKDGVPYKQTDDSIKYVRDQRGWQANEVLFIGNTDADMQSAVNGRILLLNAQWYETTMDYGFPCDTPKEVARFIDTFCFRDQFWYFRIEDGPIQVYSIAPLSTFYEESKFYSNHFLLHVKNGYAHDEDFWAKLLATSTYFDGIYDSVNYITAYPKHEAGQYPKVLVRPMTKFAKCFRKSYLPDLVTRHITAMKSQFNRSTVTHTTQLNTIQLQRRPHRIVKDQPRQYASFPIKKGSVVLVIDDVCTKGMSFEAARTYLNHVGAQVVCVSFLKALAHSYEALDKVVLPNGAFSPNTITGLTRGKTYGLSSHIVDSDAPAKLAQRLMKYKNWEWPTGI
jgi:hypothetical protein